MFGRPDAARLGGAGCSADGCGRWGARPGAAAAGARVGALVLPLPTLPPLLPLLLPLLLPRLGAAAAAASAGLEARPVASAAVGAPPELYPIVRTMASLPTSPASFRASASPASRRRLRNADATWSQG